MPPARSNSQRLRLPLGGGINGADDERNVLPGSYATFIDGYTSPNGGIHKRPGTESMSSVHALHDSASTEALVPDAIFGNGECLHAKDGDEIHTY